MAVVCWTQGAVRVRRALAATWRRTVGERGRAAHHLDNESCRGVLVWRPVGGSVRAGWLTGEGESKVGASKGDKVDK
jgi:hypothetical protein